MNNSWQPLVPASSELLATKLAPPRLHGQVVSRTAMLARLNAGLSRKLTLISAPAGFGKTTLAAEWLATYTGRVGWVALDSGDNDPVRFWRYVFTALRSIDPAIGRSGLATLNTSQQPSFEALLTSLINELALLTEPCVLALEDYHLVTTPDVHHSLAFLLEHLPATLHILLISRTEPLGLPLARLRARNELTEFGTADLRFSLEEMQAFLNQTLRVALSPEAITRLESQTEGWVAGLRLLTLALGDRTDAKDVENFLATFSGGHRHVLEYLAGEVLAAQPETVQTFLLQTSFLPRLTGALCDAVTGRTDGALLLGELERANLFLLPLGDARSPGRAWYRYHPLFADAMRYYAGQRLGEDAIQSLHQQASRWYAAHNLLNEAVELSLAAGQYEAAAGWMERWLEITSANEIHTLRRWAAQLPQDVLRQHPAVAMNLAMALLFTSDRYLPANMALVEPPLLMAEEAWRQDGNDARLGQVLSLRSVMAGWQGDLVRAFGFARESLELLSEHDVMWRGISLLSVGSEALLTGKVNTAQRILLEARALCEAAQNPHARLAVMEVLAEAYTWQGDLEQAGQYYEQIKREAVGSDEMLDDEGAALLGLATIAFERNQLAEAQTYATQALAIGEARHDEERRALSTVLLARVHWARGQTAQAQDLLRVLATQLRYLLLRREVQAWQARFALAAGDLSLVQHWQRTVAVQTDAIPLVQQEREALIVARLRLLEGNAQSALELLAGWQADASAQGRTRSELETLCLKALAQSDAHSLTQALTLAQPSGYIRLFVDEGDVMVHLLRAALPNIANPSLAAYAATVLRAFAGAGTATTPVDSPTPSPLQEPLSMHEQRVLRLLAAGLSNPEIARELVVSPNTIKTQVKSIFRKLDVSTREDAADRARQLKLI